MQDLKKLKAAGICTIKGIEMTTRKKLAAIKVSVALISSLCHNS